MKLYLLSCETIQQQASSILPHLPQQRRTDYARSQSSLTLGAGLLLSGVLGVKRDEDLRFGPQGKPFLTTKSAEFSLSHTRDRVLLGVSDRPIGVDIEHRERRISVAVQNRICLSQEKGLDALSVFTRKECAMKLTGLGFSLPLSQIDTTVPFLWEGVAYHFFTTELERYCISVLTAEESLPEIQLLTPEELL